MLQMFPTLSGYNPIGIPGRRWRLAAGWLLLAQLSTFAVSAGLLEMRNGYFWDGGAGEYVVPRGMAYQTWNPPVGANQSFAQLEYDFTEFKKMGATSVRAEFVWGEVEIADGQYDWSKPDFMVQLAEKLGLRLFVLVGFQYPPRWFQKEWYGINSQGLTANALACASANPPSARLACLPPNLQQCLATNLTKASLSNALACFNSTSSAEVLGCLAAALPAEALARILPCLISDVLNYEHPEARQRYQRHIAAVTAHFRDRAAIGGWILGNEYAYFDLWEPPSQFPVHRFLGYDSISQERFRKYLAARYENNIVLLNQSWTASYARFDDVPMPQRYPPNRRDPSYFDLIEWRKKSIGEFVALGASAAASADPRHLRTYSMVGGVYNGNDANYTAEDARTIVEECRRAGADLHFWSINNYAQAEVGSDLRSGDYGVAKYQAQSGLPVLISETGHSSTEDSFDPDSGQRQAKAVPSQIWESLISGVIGTHIFHWNDRGQFTRGYFERERGFGIVNPDRTIKSPVYENVVAMFRRMQAIKMDNLLGGSSNPPPDIQLFWSTNSDMVWPRANQENIMIWGALKRVGYQPGFLDEEGFQQGGYRQGRALLLSRAGWMAPEDLEAIATQVLPAGVHVHANADFPGQFDAGGRANPVWAARMKSIFGLNVQSATAAWDAGATSIDYQDLYFTPADPGGPPLAPGITDYLRTWKFWTGVTADQGTTVVWHRRLPSGIPTPALHFKDHSPGKAALNTFALGDIHLPSNRPHAALWDIRYDWVASIYRDYFGIQPAVTLTGPGSKYVLPDYRLCRNGSVLISLLNEHTQPAVVTLSAPGLLGNKVVENLSAGGLVTRQFDGTVTVPLTGDDYVLLYAYDRAPTADASLANPSPDKLWFVAAPLEVWPRAESYSLSVGYDTFEPGLTLGASLESSRYPGRVYAESRAAGLIQGEGTNSLAVSLPDPDLNDPGYLSSSEGGDYAWHAWLEKGGVRTSEIALPVRLSWAVRPLGLPAQVVAGGSYPITVEWEELPSYTGGGLTPLSRADLWDSLAANAEHFNVVVRLLNRQTGKVLVADNFVTSSGTGQHLFQISVPGDATGPFTWEASIAPATEVVSHDVTDGFEGRNRGALQEQRSKNPDAPSPILPWVSYNYPEGGAQKWFDEGVQLEGSEGSQSAFLIVTNPPPPLGYSGFGISYVFPAEWSLPSDRSKWANYSFRYDFKEAQGHACTLEMQIKNDDPKGTGKWLQFTKDYRPGTNGWDTVSARLDEFVRPPDTFAKFDPAAIHEIVVNIRMLQTKVVYAASIDNIQFNGPDKFVAGGDSYGIYSSANDTLRLRIANGPAAQVVIEWDGPGVLQYADELSGPWNVLLDATSPRLVTPSRAKRFFRLSAP